MKVLLINPVTREKKMTATGTTPNLGLGFIATSLRKNGFQVEIWDGLKKGMKRKRLEERLKILDYDIAGFQVFTCSVKDAREGLKMVKSLNPAAVTVIGGPHPSGDPEGTMAYLKETDFAFRGEAEIGLPKLLKKLSGDNPEYQFEDIPNLIWRENDKVICNPLQPIEDLDSLGMPSWDLINPNDYPAGPIGTFARNFPLTTISTTRGCPYTCTFCANNTIMGRTLRARSTESVLEEMQLLYDNYGVKEFQIIDDTFTSEKDLAIGVCKGIIEKGLKVTLSFPNGVRLNTLDKEVLQWLEKAGCYSLGVGIESGSEKTLKTINKVQTLNEIREKLEFIKRVCKIGITGFFIVGYPGEEKKDILATIKFSKELPLKRAQFVVFLPGPGSEMTEKLKSEGKLKNLGYGDIFAQNIVYAPENMTLRQLKRLRLRAYSEFYLRPRILFGVLSEIQSMEQLKFLLGRVVQLFH